ncbi:hypothetical protein Tco_1079581 [Tanacetum coccineum]|uniref:Gag-Pol polyprotein n=1 Tax=Tanacetum coccineum TaxID=301880 RepID=A0ABQ5HS90_9ASTR
MSSRHHLYAKSRPSGKFNLQSIRKVPIRRMIPEPGGSRTVKMEADDQAIQTILLGLPEDIYAAVDSCETAQEIWFTSTDGESIESYYHRFSKLMNDFKRNKHFPEKIASNLKFLNNLQPEWSRHVTIVHQTKDLHTTDYTQLYDFLKYNQKEVDDQRAERLAKTHDPSTHGKFQQSFQLSSVSPRSTITKYLHATTITQQQQLYTPTIIQPELHATTNAKS